MILELSIAQSPAGFSFRVVPPSLVSIGMMLSSAELLGFCFLLLPSAGRPPPPLAPSVGLLAASSFGFLTASSFPGFPFFREPPAPPSVPPRGFPFAALPSSLVALS
uniref:Uncharacterized protein n=1 Tax=Anopheles atroparvus TaxID=41427 RepID=A0AAG5D7Q9_ANOAO